MKNKKEKVVKKEHKKWMTIIGDFKSLSKPDYYYIKGLLDKGDNVLIMIRRTKDGTRQDQQNIFNGLCKSFADETKTSQLIISAVPDIEQVVFLQ